MLIGSMCSGYGGLDAAVQAVIPSDLAWVADPDLGAAKILTHHHPHVPNLGDITTVDWATVPAVDILTAGFPCQDISNAGKRAGIEGTRSGIWTHVVAAVGVLRPRFAVFENVGALVVRGLDTVLADLAEIGFDAEWSSVRASDAGAPHRRERIFILAWSADAPGPGLEAGWEGRPGGGADADPAHLGHQRPGGARVGGPGSAHRGHSAAYSEGVGHGHTWQEGIPRVPAAAVTGDPGRADAVATDPDGAGHPRLQQEPQGVDLHSELGDHVERRGAGAWGTHAPAIARWEHITGRAAPVSTELGRHGQPQLSPRFVEWLMGLPDGHVTAPAIGLTRNQQLKALGNGVVPHQGAAALRLLLDRAVAEVAA